MQYGDIAGAMNAVLADVFSLYVKTKNFHWHMSGPHCRDYHELLDEQAALFATSMETSPAQALSRFGSTRPNGGPGFVRSSQQGPSRGINARQLRLQHRTPADLSVTQQLVHIWRSLERKGFDLTTICRCLRSCNRADR